MGRTTRDGAQGIGVIAVAMVLAACSSPAAPPPKIEAAPEPQKIDHGPTMMESEIGGLNEDAMDQAFNSLSIQSCVERASERVGHLGGEFKLKLRIDKKGAPRWAYLAESTLGDRETEKCVLELARAKSWPKPLGGEGLAEKTYAIDPPAQPVTLDVKRVSREVQKARQETQKCRRGFDGAFSATVYLEPDGHVTSAGVAVPNEKGEDAADCIVEALLKVHFQAPGKKVAKVTFDLR